MPRRDERELIRKHVWIAKADWDWIIEKFGPANIKPSTVLRTVISGYIRTMQAREADVHAQGDGLPLDDIDLTLDPDELRAADSG